MRSQRSLRLDEYPTLLLGAASPGSLVRCCDGSTFSIGAASPAPSAPSFPTLLFWLPRRLPWQSQADVVRSEDVPSKKVLGMSQVVAEFPPKTLLASVRG